jgi:hypothetical protein
MPSAPTTPRRASNNRRSAPPASKASESKPLDLYDTNSVRDRIRQWQEQNAALASPVPGGSDISHLSADDDKVESKRQKTRQAYGGKEDTKTAESTPRRKSSRWVDPAQREWVREARSSSTPRKRVVSDEHWRKSRSPRDAKPGPSAAKKDVGRAERPITTATERSPGYNERQARRMRRRELRQSNKLKEQQKEVDDHGNVPNAASENLSVANERDTHSNIDYELARRLDSTTSPVQWEEREDDDTLRPENDDGRHRRRSQYADALGRSPRSSQIGPGDAPASSLRSKKGSIFSQARGLFTKPDPVSVPSPRLPSIEAWLEEQPDPFQGEEKQSVLVPAPLDPKSRRKERTAEAVTLKDPNNIWACIDKDDSLEIRQSRNSRRRRRRREALDDVGNDIPAHKDNDTVEPRKAPPEVHEEDQNSSEMSPVALKRRGAKHSRDRKDSSQRERSIPSSSSHNPATETVPPVAPPHETCQPTQETSPRTQKQCPPTGPHRLSTIASVETFQARPEAAADIEPPLDVKGGLKRRLTTHEDLMSVLSLPRASKSIKSARSVRSTRNRVSDRPVNDLMKEFAADEVKYMRELWTLVEGVIPVLLQSVLSKSRSTVAAGLFTTSRTANDDLNFAQPIVEMGVALERLKTLHNRAPTKDALAIPSWAQSVHRVYTDYLRAWRLGFQDVVVNLAPADGQTNNPSDLGMARDDNGDIVNEEGQKVDVAYLLKRPLVRIKNLSKLLNQLKTINPSSRASQVAEDYADLVTLARRRSNEEQSRLEDEAASNIDPTKARDLRTLAALTGVKIDSSKKVKARDCFNLTLYHSTGQRIDCRVELLLRDNPPGLADGGDLLVCEVEDTGRWLLLPPTETALLSARIGDTAHDLVVMVRESPGSRHPWHELLCLKADNDEAALEWVQMLGSDPLPPKVNRSPDFISRAHALAAAPPVYSTALVLSSTAAAAAAPAAPASKNIDLRNIDVPIGEPSVLCGDSDQRTWTASSPSQSVSDFHGSMVARPGQAWSTHSSSSQVSSSKVSSSRGSVSQSSVSQVPQNKPLPARPKLSLGGELASPSRNFRNFDRLLHNPAKETPAGLRRAMVGKSDRRHEEHSPNGTNLSHSSKAGGDARPGMAQRKINRTDKTSREWMTSGIKRSTSPVRPLAPPSPEREGRAETRSEKPAYKRGLSSTPSRELPTISRTRPAVQGETAPDALQNESKRIQRTALPAAERRDRLPSHSPQSSPEARVRTDQRRNRVAPFTEDVPPPPPHANRSESVSQPSSPAVDGSWKPVPPHANRSETLSQPSSPAVDDSWKPVPPPHGQPSLSCSKTPNDFALGHESQSVPAESKVRSRLSSSPLKHEYAPSITSDSSSDSESDDSFSSSSSDTSEDPISEHGDAPTPLLPVTAATMRRPFKSVPPSSFPRRATTTLAPSDSASQGPYRSVPSSSALPSERSSRAIAMVCSWSDQGVWESLHPDECSIVISPGLIEAYEMSEAHSGRRPSAADRHKLGSDSASTPTGTSPSVTTDMQPLVAFELTPLVPLRRGTALDISIRSPPTAKSKIRKSNNVMFRCRTADECEALYAMINYARINNPTYIALQNARPSYQPPVTFNTSAGSARHSSHRSRSKSGSWFGFGSQGKKSSYRASSTPMSVGGASESSIGSISSAFSALKRFSGEGGMFNLNRSSVQKKHGGGASGSASLYSSSSGTTGTGSGSASPVPSQLGLPTVKEGIAMPDGTVGGGGAGVVNNMKIRVYRRESASRWRDLGAARLTVLPAPRPLISNPPPDNGTSTPPKGGPNDPSPLGTPIASRAPSMMLPSQPNANPDTPPNSVSTRDGPRLASSAHTPHRIHGHAHEKRIIITSSKSKNLMLSSDETGGVTLLDAVLGESCFERVARTGIAVSVWSEDEVIAKEGGVIGGRTTTYMLQMKGEAEAAWVFGLVGRLRY